MRIKEARKMKKMTQKELADRIGVDFSVISRYENGTIIPPATRLESIAKILDVTVDYLLGKDTSISIPLQRRSVFKLVEHDQLAIHDSLAMKEALFCANGKCELCGQQAPFNDANGNPYLEIHFIHWLSEGGMPIPENTVALCPNCHTKIHILNDPQDINKLKIAANKHPKWDV